MLLLEGIVLLLFDDHILLLLLELLFQEVNQVVVAFVQIFVISQCQVSEVTTLADSLAFLSVASLVTSILTLLMSLGLINLLQLMLQAFYDFLAEVRTFSEFLFDLFVNFDFTLVRFNLLLHFVVLEDEDFSLL